MNRLVSLRLRRAVLLVMLGGGALACAPVEPPPAIASPDRQAFDTQVWPILVRDCGFSECHGNAKRFFVVYGPGHERLDPVNTRLSDPVTEQELQRSYDRARGMIDTRDPGQSPLLRKPLEVSAGGAGHEGTDSFSRDVYANESDPSYQALYTWVVSQAP